MPLVPISDPARQIAELLRAPRLPIPHRPAQPTSLSAAARPDPGPGPQRAVDLARLYPFLEARRSVRDFAARPVDPAALVAALDDGYAAERRLWPADRHGDARLLALVAAFDVADRAPGLYCVPPPQARPSAEPAALGEFLGPQDWLPALRDEYPAAPAIVLVCGDVTTPAQGGCGYGSAVTRAAGLGYAAWLAAVGAGLAGSVFGGTVHPATTAAHRLDARLRHLFTVAIGHAADDADD